MIQRNTGGRFVQGNCGGPGRPRRATEERFVATISETVSADDWRAIVERAKAVAMAGDAAARNWLSKHLLGSGPPQAELTAAEKLELADRLLDEVAQDETFSPPSGQ